MDEGQPINLDEIVRELRRQHDVLPPASAISPDDGPVAADLAALHNSHDIYHIQFTSHRKILGWLVVSAKRVLQKLLTPVLERQLVYNGANLRIIASLWGQSELLRQLGVDLVEKLRRTQQDQAGALQALRRELGEQIGGMHQEQGAVVQAMRVEIAEQLGRFQQEQLSAAQALRGELTAQLEAMQQEQKAAVQALRGELTVQLEAMQQAHGVALHAMRERSSRAERRVRRFVHVLTNGQPTDGEPIAKSPPEERKILPRDLEPDFDYFGLEERFRGSEEDIKGRQRVYLDYFKGLDQVLDIGCGRGEFLELLAEAGVKAKGVDVDLDMVLYCQEKGLDVVRADAFAYLDSLPDESLGGIFAAQVIEHLEPLRIVELVRLCQRKLRPGSPLILETPNPACLMVFARSFYMDLSHIRPIHPETMRFVLESTGFHDVQLKFSAPVEAVMRIPPLSGSGTDGATVEEFNKAVERLNELLYGCQDYAVIGMKSSLRDAHRAQ